MEKVLIAGIAGGLGRLLAKRLQGSWRVCGVDRNAWEGRPRDIRVRRVDLRKREFGELLRQERPRAVVHMGFVRHFRGDETERHDINVRGTKALLDHCVRFGVEQLVLLSSGYVYGAFADNPFYLDEEHPLAASRAYPEIRDLVEVDAMATAFLWRQPQVRSAVLRPVSTLGANADTMIRETLTRRRVPVVMGFDPIMQFIHEADVVEAVAGCLERELRGVFNVVGPGAVPISEAIRACGGQRVPIPEFAMRPLYDRLFRSGWSSAPAGVLDYMKYSVTLSGARFAEATGFEAKHSLAEIFEATRSSAGHS